MSSASWPLIANISLLFSELPLHERGAAAMAAGFAGVEAWWSFPTADGGESVEEFLSGLESQRVPLTGLNFFAGDMPGGERGLLSRTDRREDLLTNIDVIAAIAERTGARGFNALYGQRRAGLDVKEQDRTALENAVVAAQKLAPTGSTVLIEPLSRGMNGEYPIERAAQAVEFIRRARDAAGLENIALLFDTFHLTNNGDDLVGVIDTYGDLIGHVQLADTPGRGEPGTGDIDFAAVFDALARVGYAGPVACEYTPVGATVDGLGWVDAFEGLSLSEG